MSCAHHQCHRTNCDSEATHEAHLRLWFDGLVQPLPLDMRSSMRCCEGHIPAFTIWLLSERNKLSIAAGLAMHGFGDPDFSSAEIEFVPIGSMAEVA